MIFGREGIPAVQKPWLEQYPEGVPAEAPVSAFPSLVALLDDAFKRYGERDASICLGSRMRYRELDEHSRAIGAWLQARGLQRGARVAIMMPNLPQYLVSIAAVLRAGCIVVNINPLYTPRELALQLNDSGAEAIVVLEGFAATLEEVIDDTQVRHVLLAAVGDLVGPWRGAYLNFAVRHLRRAVPEFRLPLDRGRTVTRFRLALTEGARLTLRDPGVGPDDVAFLQYTGGTTGVSKGAVLLHRNIVANVMQCDVWFRPLLHQLGQERPQIIVCALPLYHIFALTICGLLGARLGATNVLIPNPRDVSGLIGALAGLRVNMFPAVNTLFAALLEDPAFARLDFTGLVVSNGGGMAVQRSVAERWLKVTGCPVAEGYGLSETSPVVTSNRLDLRDFTGTIGLPLPSTEISIRDDYGREVGSGEAGEICIRGPQVMAGYWNRPDETSNVMTIDGYFRSGDIGVMDERGYFSIVDRKKDMILVSGFNVYPTEIEQVVSAHPGVLECAAIGVPDSRSGEAVKLFAVKRDPSLDEGDLSAYCAQNLTGYKRPKYIEFRDELPKSNVGKILRRQLRASSS